MKQPKYKGIAVLLLIIGFSALLACQTPAGRSTGEVIDDSTISTTIKAKFFGDDQLSGLAISVKTFEGEVTLTGAVKSAKQKNRATNIAQSVTGVKAVNNLLKIKP
jgi:hyperosmotically inducible protein